MNIEKKLSDLSKNIKVNTSDSQPSFFRLNNDLDKKAMNKLLDSNPNIIVHDELLGQVEELVKSRNPKIDYEKTQLTDAAKDFLGNMPFEEYGVWVYYPWSFRLVHILDEKEFVEVRTNRNQYKIMPQETEALAKHKIGVIGLSVGQSVAVTLAMERVCGELRLADYDVLELTNLNRIRTGVHNLNIPKVVSVAREIAEIDPFLKVVCYPEGLTEENMDDFFLKGGKLSICIDECDGLDIKILCRYKARELGVPVVMEASDRGTVDVERFDLEPNRPVLHGWIDHLDHTRLKHLRTNEEKMPYILAMVGLDTCSERLKASMLEIEQTITTWPQLASAVALGGGVTTDVCRRIILDQFHESGRYFVDVEELIADGKASSIPVQEEHSSDVLLNEPAQQEKNSMRPTHRTDTAHTSVAKNQVDLNDATINQIVTAAVTAPSGGNCQPWQWQYKGKNLYLFFDPARSLSSLDFDNKASFIALGAAAENLILKAHELNLEVILEKFPDSKNEELIAVFRFFNKIDSTIDHLLESHDFDTLTDSISMRLTNRIINVRQVIEKEKLNRLQKIAGSIPGADLQIIDEEQTMLAIGEIMAKTDRIIFTNKETHHDLVSELRWSEKEAKQTRDGIDINTIDLTASELVGFKLAKNWSVVKYVNNWKGGSVFEKLTRKAVAASSALGLISMPNYSPVDFFDGGRVVQRVWLSANEQNISLHPLSSAIFLFARLYHGKGIGMTDKLIKELTGLKDEFMQLLSLDDNTGKVFLFRLCVADTPGVISLRRSVEDVLTIKP